MRQTLRAWYGLHMNTNTAPRFYTTVASNIAVGASLVDIDTPRDATLRGAVHGARVASATYVDMFRVVEFQAVRPNGERITFAVTPGTIVEVDALRSAE